MKKSPKMLKAHIKGIPQPNELFLRGKIKKGLPMERTIYLVGIDVPLVGNKDRPDDPFAF